jgi:hypothetical protein
LTVSASSLSPASKGGGPCAASRIGDAKTPSRETRRCDEVYGKLMGDTLMTESRPEEQGQQPT